jgi:hypothetical protein
MSPKSLYVKGLVTSVVLLEDDENFQGVVAGRSLGQWAHALEGDFGSVSLSLLHLEITGLLYHTHPLWCAASPQAQSKDRNLQN